MQKIPVYLRQGGSSAKIEEIRTRIPSHFAQPEQRFPQRRWGYKQNPKIIQKTLLLLTCSIKHIKNPDTWNFQTFSRKTQKLPKPAALNHYPKISLARLSVVMVVYRFLFQKMQQGLSRIPIRTITDSAQTNQPGLLIMSLAFLFLFIPIVLVFVCLRSTTLNQKGCSLKRHLYSLKCLLFSEAVE